MKPLNWSGICNKQRAGCQRQSMVAGRLLEYAKGLWKTAVEAENQERQEATRARRAAVMRRDTSLITDYVPKNFPGIDIKQMGELVVAEPAGMLSNIPGGPRKTF
jgi:hypothetical protein